MNPTRPNSPIPGIAGSDASRVRDLPASARSRAQDKHHNVWDAVGVGLFVVGRLSSPPGRFFPGEYAPRYRKQLARVSHR